MTGHPESNVSTTENNSNNQDSGNATPRTIATTTTITIRTTIPYTKNYFQDQTFAEALDIYRTLARHEVIENFIQDLEFSVDNDVDLVYQVEETNTNTTNS